MTQTSPPPNRQVAAGNLYTAQQVADLLQVERQTIYAWIRNSQLPARKAGKMIRITAESVDKFLKESR